MIEYRMVPLSAEADVSDFDCGNEDLNDFLKSDALNNVKDWISVTHLMYVENELAGFFTITPDTLHKGRIELSDKLDDYPYQKYPAIKLARIAVDKRFQHMGYANELMNEFFEVARDAVDVEGGRFLTVDAKKGVTGFYEKFGFRAVTSAKANETVPMYLDFFKYYNL